MAQTISILQAGDEGKVDLLKKVALNVANGAAETSLVVNWKTYGLGKGVAWGMMPRDTYTNNVMFADLGADGTTVTYTWSAADIANILLWAEGY